MTKKTHYPKQMTIRYDKDQEKKIQVMMARTGDNTMSKAFLKTPALIDALDKRIATLTQLVERQQAEITDLQDVAKSFRHLTISVSDYFKKKQARTPP